MISRYISAPERLFMRVDTSGECWEWKGNVSAEGYAKLMVNRKFVYAHRYAYELLVEPIPDGLVIDHICHNRRCVRPSHLEPVSANENRVRSDHLRGRDSGGRYAPIPT